MSKLELLLLGHFECLLPSGKPATLSMRKAEVLLAFLAITPGIRHPRERLTNLLWSNRGEEQARNSLRQCLSTIRKSLGDAAELALEVDRNTVRLNSELIEVDALEFERLAANTELESLTSAAELYRGEFLAGISIRDAASQEWMDSERARFKRQYIDILTDLGHIQLAARDFTHAIRTAENLVAQDSLSESGWRLLMRACHENGERSHALQAFKRCQQVLDNELNVEPEAETLALRDAIASGLGKADTPAPATTATDSTVPSTATNVNQSIAVLPFDNLSGDPEQEYFSDGITADIISTLSKFRHLHIVARHSTEVYRERKASITEIAGEQGVRYILEGSVRRSGKRIRVSAELIDSQDGKICWSERYDRDLDDLFAVQDEITQKITLAMKVHLDDGEMARHRSAGTKNIKAWELVMNATDLTDTYIRQNILQARALSKQALALDPEYVFAHVIHAWTFWQEVYSGWSKDHDKSLAEAEQHSHQALKLDPDNADALAQAGTAFIMRHDVEKALEYSSRAVKLEPGNAENQALLAFAHVFAGNYDQARAHEKNTRRLCPIMPNWYYLILAQIEQLDGDLEKAIAIYRQGLAVEVDSPLCRFYLVHALTQKGDLVGAQKLADEIRALDSSVNGSGLVRAYSQDAKLRNQFYQHLKQFGLV